MSKKSFIFYILIIGLILVNNFAYAEVLEEEKTINYDNQKNLQEVVRTYNAQFEKNMGNSLIGYNKQTKNSESVNVEKVINKLSRNSYLPVEEKYLSYTSRFGKRGSVYNGSMTVDNIAMHTGLDISAANIENSNVYAILEGKIEKVEYSNVGYGNLVIIDHGDFRSYYAHLNSIENFQEGDYVRGGQVIGKVGNTGRSTGPHLHLEINVGYTALNPELFIGYLKAGNKVIAENKLGEKLQEVTREKPVEKKPVDKKDDYKLTLDPVEEKPDRPKKEAYGFDFTSEREAYPFEFSGANKEKKDVYSFEFDFQ